MAVEAPSIAPPGRGADPVDAVEASYPPPRASADPDKSKSGLRRMLPIIFGRRSLLIISVVTSLIAMGGMVIAPKVTQYIVDTVILKGKGGLRLWALVLVALALVRFGFGLVSRYTMQKLAFEVQYDLRNMMYAHLNCLSFNFYDRAQTGELISRANSDIRAVEMFLAFGPMMIVVVTQFILAFVLMVTMHLLLSLFALLPLSAIYFVGLKMRVQMFPMSWIVMARAAEVSTIVEENVTGIRVVKSFAAEREQVGLLARAAQKLRWASIKQLDIQARFGPLLENLPRLGVVVVILYGGWLVIQGQIGIGTLIAFNAYILLMAMPFMIFGMLIMLAQRASASADRILEILDETPDIQDRPGAQALAKVRGDVEFEDVVFSYASGPPVLRGFSMRLSAGETVAMVGRTGCGKSTVARLIPRFYDIDEGAVCIDGNDVRDFTIHSLRAQVGLVLDEPFLFSQSIRENIAYGRPAAPIEDVIRVAKLAAADEFIARLPEGYDTVIGERGYTLSGGQRQRIAIARTLLMNPPILILDDATSSIDVQVEQEIHEDLKHLMRGRTTLIIAHRLSTISLADRVVLMDQGQVVAQGSHQELLREVPLYGDVLARTEKEWEEAHERRLEEETEEHRRLAAVVAAVADADRMPGIGDGMGMGDGMGEPLPSSGFGFAEQDEVGESRT